MLSTSTEFLRRAIAEWEPFRNALPKSEKTLLGDAEENIRLHNDSLT
jgi:hypothetical protein